MIFQSTIDTLEADIRKLQQQIEAKNQRQNELIHLEAVADSAIDTLQETISKIQFAVPDAIASLKSAVMGLFPSDGNDGGNQPYLVTSGNYKGLARQTRQRWEKAGIDPQGLIAEMRERRPPEPAWNAAKYNPRHEDKRSG
jgi:hypothetical protein